MASEDQSHFMYAVVARAMSDEAFRVALTADPAAVLRAEGLDIPADAKITVLQSSASETFLVLPDPSAVNDELLAASSGGSTVGTGGTVGSVGTASLTSTFIGTLGTVGSAGTAGSA